MNEIQPWRYNPDKIVETVMCPYCEQEITGTATELMAHGIACRQQWEIRNNQTKSNSDESK